MDEKIRKTKYRFGKKVGEHLYLHVSTLEDEVGFPRDLWAKIQRAWYHVERTPVVSTIPNRAWDIVKLHHRLDEVTFLWYPDFFTDAHPSLHRSLRVVPKSLMPVVLTFWSPDGVDAPILHRKELFLTHDHPERSVFARLTKQEEEAGLYRETSTIGRRGPWERLLKERGYYIRNHRLYRT